jgi:hypothetical protein
MLTLVSLAEIPRITDPQLSPDGRFVSYALARADWQANRQVTHIWRQATSGGSAAQVTSGDGSEMLARWSPDSASIAFLARASDGLQIFLVGGDGSARRQLTHHTSRVYGGAPPVWSPDGEESYFLASDPPGALERDQHRLRDDLAEYQSNVKPRHLWRIAVATGAEQRIAEGSFSVLSFLALSRRNETRRAPGPDDAGGRRGAIGDLGERRDRRQRASRHGERRRGSRGGALARHSEILFISDANAQLEPLYNTRSSSSRHPAARRVSCCPSIRTPSTTPHGRVTARPSWPSSTWGCAVRSFASTSGRGR